MNFSLYFTKGRKSPVFAVILTSLYAVTDEVHQIFVEGRSCELGDWAIDTMGAILGAIGFLIIIIAIERVIQRKKIDTGNN